MERPPAKPGATSAAILAAACLLALAWGGPGASSAAQTTVLGAATAATASCPDSCLVEAHVTGFQTSIEGATAPFAAPRRGSIVAWSIKLGLPDKPDIKFFNKSFGQSKARISILKPVRARRRGRGPTYVLLRESPVENLRPYFGTLATFSLSHPLKVGRGQIVALTMPTWAPAFSVGQSDLSRWRASRTPTRRRGKCFTKRGLANLEAGGAHQDMGSRRAYGCAYRGARLLYSAVFAARS